jgi:hypothetical protein
MTQESYDSELLWLDMQVTRNNDTKAFLVRHKDWLLANDIRNVVLTGFVHLLGTRQNILDAIKYFGGKWKRQPVNGTLQYTRMVDGINVQLSTDEVPPSCTWREVTRVVPQRTETRLELICHTGDPDAAILPQSEAATGTAPAAATTANVPA